MQSKKLKSFVFYLFVCLGFFGSFSNAFRLSIDRTFKVMVKRCCQKSPDLSKGGQTSQTATAPALREAVKTVLSTDRKDTIKVFFLVANKSEGNDNVVLTSLIFNSRILGLI